MSRTPMGKYQYWGLMPENWSRAIKKIIAPMRPPKPAGAAEHKDDQYVGRALEIDHAE